MNAYTTGDGHGCSNRFLFVVQLWKSRCKKDVKLLFLNNNLTQHAYVGNKIAGI